MKFGPYTLGKVPEPNNVIEVPILSSIRRIMFQYYRDRTKEASTVLREKESEMVIEKTKKAFKEQRKRREQGSLDDFVSNRSSEGHSMLSEPKDITDKAS